jgi:UDP-N-acetylmuramoyl-L-alanyl-D-glutamate--2,6-diaminopimelate ligase
MLLRELVAAVPHARLIGDGDIEITSVEFDSRAAGEGSLFVAVPGFKTDGHAYLARAIEGGAPAVAVQEDHAGLWRPIAGAGGADVVVMPDTRAGLAKLSAEFFGHPARQLGVIGVTGTDGKTSLCHLVAHVLNSASQKAGLISTAECRIGEVELPDTGRFTTPEAPQVQAMLAMMVEANCRWAVVEATSHGLALHRVDECEYDIAAFTNVGRDHLDFHGSQEAYLEAKGRLFTLLDHSTAKGIEKIAVLNVDDPAFAHFSSVTHAHEITYSMKDPLATVRATVRRENDHANLEIVVDRGAAIVEHNWAAAVRFPRTEPFNWYNALAATGIAVAAGLTREQIVRGLETWGGAPGRMQHIEAGQPFSVIVDFAHSPDSLRRVLQLLRETTRGRIIAVFGCIGERDKDRRPGMAQAAAALADYIFVTDDNPYSEDRGAILGDIANALRSAGKREGHDFAVVPDRRDAISQALAMAVDEDAVLLAGKGHEREVHLGNEVYPCYDPDVARAVLRDLGYAR